MKRYLSIIMAVAVALILSASANATITLSTTALDRIFFSNVENWLDNDGDQQISPGDTFYGILHIQNVDAPNTIWNEDNVPAGGIDTLTGYFLTDVAAVGVGPSNQTHITLAPAAADPNGVITAPELGAGVVIKLYIDEGPVPPSTQWTNSFGPGSDIPNAIDGIFWASLGLTGPNTYWYTHAPVTPPVQPGSVVGDSWFGLDFVVNATGYTFKKIDDPLETEAALISGVPSLVDMYGTSNINVSFSGPWAFTSNDPAALAPIPEPTSLFLLGAGLLSLAGVRIRKRVSC